MSHSILPAALLALALFAPSSRGQEPGEARARPNVVFVMADELALYELSHMGHPQLRTPNIDRFAAEGIRFARAYAGAPVCAPLRCNLMTGKHAGHASVRANDGGTPLRAGEETIASMLKGAGYATGGFGKWGCGGRGSTGVPEDHGFDEFFGYYDQVHAHSYYPPYLIHNSDEVPLAGNDGGREGATWSHGVIMDRALEFIRAHADGPFFCYLPITPPHGLYDIPADDPAWREYEGAAWMEEVGQDVRNYAAMVTRVDQDLGRVLALLDELGLEEDTLVFFTGDNGGQDRFRSKEHPRGYFGPNVDPRTGAALRGGKGNLYEGGLRIPFLARWPGTVAPGRVSRHLLYQPDVLPTLAAVCGVEVPADVDGLSFAPELLGRGRKQAEHPFLYWEFGNQLAVRIGDHKGVLRRPRRGGGSSWSDVLERGAGTWELFDLAADPCETTDLAGQKPELLVAMARIARREHTPVRAGSYMDPARTLHEKDRRAKWGSRGRPGRRAADVHRIEDPDRIPAAELKVVSASSENTANGKLARFAVDGDPTTVWHSAWSGGLAEPPHELVLDLGGTRTVTGFRYLARQDPGWNGTFGRTEFRIADAPDGFASPPVAVADFRRLKTAQAVDLPHPVQGRYVQIRILTEASGGPWASAAEIGVVAGRR